MKWPTLAYSKHTVHKVDPPSDNRCTPNRWYHHNIQVTPPSQKVRFTVSSPHQPQATLVWFLLLPLTCSCSKASQKKTQRLVSSLLHSMPDTHPCDYHLYGHRDGRQTSCFFSHVWLSPCLDTGHLKKRQWTFTYTDWWTHASILRECRGTCQVPAALPDAFWETADIPGVPLPLVAWRPLHKVRPFPFLTLLSM